MKADRLLTRIDELTKLGQSVLATSRPIQHGDFALVDEGAMSGFRAAALSFIEQQYGTRHTHYVEFSRWVGGSSDKHIGAGLAILSAIRSEVAGGWLTSIKSLIAAEIFSDFMEMAAHLLASGYKDAAAVMIGSVLEEHLRQLSQSNGISVTRDVDGVPVPKKADALNSELAKAGAYNSIDQKAVTAWLDLRNKGAHGKYGEYEKAQVDLMREGVLAFMARNPP